MNIAKAKAELQAAMTGPAGKNWSYGPAVKTILNELAAKDAELKEYRKRALSLPDALDAVVDQVLAVDTIASTAALKALFYQKTGLMRLELAAGVELQEYRKAVSQPVGWTDEQELRSVEKDGCGYLFKANPVTPNADPRRVILLYTAAPSLLDEREKIRAAHAEWSRATFGIVGPTGPLKHLSKEALEAASEPGDLSEWADMQFLLWDAQRNAGITDEQITAAMIAKLEVNKARKWPEPKDGEPRLHIKGSEHENY